MHVFRWDLDRTYLDTDIHSVRGMIRTAMEQAEEKRNIPGSAALLRGLIRTSPGCRVSIISGSPTQMREVLEAKLALDGVRFDSLVLKDNLGNLRRGRFRALREQVGYKLPQLLQSRVGLGQGVQETLFGDDTEVDALIYRLYAEAISARVDEGELSRVMTAAGAYPDTIQAATAALRKVGKGPAVQDIFIHADRGLPLQRYRLLGRQVVPVFSWLQAAVLLWLRGHLHPDEVTAVVQSCMEEDGLDERAVASLVQDLVRRARIEPHEVAKLLEQATGLAPIADPLRRAMGRLGRVPTPPAYVDPPDFVGFLRAAK